MGGLIMKAMIKQILVKERIRKDIATISELAEDIRKSGLLHPVTVMMLDGGKYQLLAGLRRLKAVQSMSLTEIEITVVFPTDAEAALHIEISENEQREEFTYSEKMDYARLLKDIERAKANERMLAGKKISEGDPVPLGAQGQAGRTRDIVASKDSSIESLKRQNAELIEALEAAEARLAELEERHANAA
jgi:ParB family chromosome partitioning protein